MILAMKEHIAVEQYEHTTDDVFFEQWFSERLLKEVPRGCTIIMDNASFHRKEALLEVIKKARRKVKRVVSACIFC